MFSQIEPLTLAVPGRLSSPDSELKVSLLGNHDSKALLVSNFSLDSLEAVSLLSADCSTVVFDCKNQDLKGDELIASFISLYKEGKNVVLLSPGEALQSGIEQKRLDSILNLRTDLRETIDEFCPGARPDPRAREAVTEIENRLTVLAARERLELETEMFKPLPQLPEISARSFALNDDTVILCLGSGNGLLSESAAFQQAIRETFSVIDSIKSPADLRQVIVDLSPIEAMEGGATAALISLRSDLKKQNQDIEIILTGISEPVRELLERQKLDRIFRVIPDPQVAIEQAGVRPS